MLTYDLMLMPKALDMNINTSIRDSTAVIRLEGRFDFAGHRDFREAFKAAVQSEAAREIQIDLRNVVYIDSSALGMLLLSLENAKAAGKTISLTGATGPVKQVLDIANFHKLFTIK